MTFPHSILVVDDEELITKSLSDLLQHYGYYVMTASNGNECLQILSAQRFDLVILDIVMPGMSGIEVLKEIKEKYKDTEVIMITGYADKDKAIAAFRLNVYDLIEKPYGSEEILNTIANCLKQMELKKEIEKKSQELRESEEQYRSIFIEARDGIVLIEKGSCNIFDCNPEFERQTGRKLEHLKKMKIWEVMPSEIVETAKKIFSEMKEKRTDGSGEFSFRKPDGKIVTIESVSRIVGIRGRQFIQSITRDITKRKQAEEELRRTAIENARLFESVKNQREQLHALTTRLAESEEAERNRLARELHDQVGQNLTGLGINLNIVRVQMPERISSQILSRLDDSLSLVEQTTERIRNMMTDLKPPVLNDYGLVTALRWYAAQFSSRAGISIDIKGEEPNPRLSPSAENALFRISQEALTNIAKHAQATRVTVIVEVEKKKVRLVITDNGIGFKYKRLNQRSKALGWGLLTMRERAEAIGSRFHIESRPGQGTRVIVEVAR